MSDNSNALKILSRSLKAISKINQDLLSFNSEKKLCQNICNDLVQIKGYKFVWMGLRENGSGILSPIAIAGKDKDFVKSVRGSWDKYGFNGCPTSMALKRGKNFTNKDLKNVQRFVPWDKKATEEGFLSALILPIRYHNDVIGTLHVYSDMNNYFLKEELSFLNEVAGDIGLGIKSIKDDRKSITRKIEYKELFKRMSSCVAIYTASDNGNDFIIKDFNKAAEKTEKIKRKDIIGKSILKVFPGVKDFGLFDVFKRVYKTGKPESHPISNYKDKRISGWRESFVYKLPNTDVVAVYNDLTEKKQAEDELISSKNRFKELVEKLPEIVVETDKELNIKYVNKRFKDILGYNKADIKKGINVLQLLAPEYLTLAKKNIEIIKRKGKKTPVDYEFIKKDGSTIYGITNSNVIYDDDKHFSGLRIVGMDITKHKKLVEVILNLSKYPSQNPNPIIRVDCSGIVLYFNDVCKKVQGLDLTVGMVAPQFILEYVLKADKLKSGSDIIVKIGTKTLVFSFVSTKEKEYITLYGKDITELKKAQENITASDAKYRELFNSAPVGLAVIDNEGTITSVNKAMLSMGGISKEEILGKNFTEIGLLEPKDIPFYKEVFTKILGGETTEPFIIDWRNRQGGKITGEVYSALLKKDGKVEGFQLIISNITERLSSEENLEKSYKKLKDTFDSTIKTLASVVETKDPYTSGHQTKVAKLSVAIAKELKLDEHKIDEINKAATIHDIGKIIVPQSILSKPSILSDLEFSLIKTHCQAGYDILKNIDFGYPIADIVIQHHERENGSGYPKGLIGSDIMLEAKIIAVADVVEAMSSHRPYRPALGIKKALEEIENNKGILYNSEIADACINLFETKHFSF